MFKVIEKRFGSIANCVSNTVLPKVLGVTSKDTVEAYPQNVKDLPTDNHDLRRKETYLLAEGIDEHSLLEGDDPPGTSPDILQRSSTVQYHRNTSPKSRKFKSKSKDMKQMSYMKSVPEKFTRTRYLGPYLHLLRRTRLDCKSSITTEMFSKDLLQANQIEIVPSTSFSSSSIEQKKFRVRYLMETIPSYPKSRSYTLKPGSLKGNLIPKKSNPSRESKIDRRTEINYGVVPLLSKIFVNLIGKLPDVPLEIKRLDGLKSIRKPFPKPITGEKSLKEFSEKKHEKNMFVIVEDPPKQWNRIQRCAEESRSDQPETRIRTIGYAPYTRKRVQQLFLKLLHFSKNEEIVRRNLSVFKSHQENKTDAINHQAVNSSRQAFPKAICSPFIASTNSVFPPCVLHKQSKIYFSRLSQILCKEEKEEEETKEAKEEDVHFDSPYTTSYDLDASVKSEQQEDIQASPIVEDSLRTEEIAIDEGDLTVTEAGKEEEAARAEVVGEDFAISKAGEGDQKRDEEVIKVKHVETPIEVKDEKKASTMRAGEGLSKVSQKGLFDLIKDLLLNSKNTRKYSVYCNQSRRYSSFVKDSIKTGSELTVPVYSKPSPFSSSNSGLRSFACYKHPKLYRDGVFCYCPSVFIDDCNYETSIVYRYGVHYENPEYYLYHAYSFYDLHYFMQNWRVDKCPPTPCCPSPCDDAPED